MANPFDPKSAGAETAGDVTAFMLGASLGGVLDATLNVFGFAEPLIAATVCGPGALGLKKLVFDLGKDAKRSKESLARLEVEIELLAELGETKRADIGKFILEKGKARGLPYGEIVDMVEAALEPAPTPGRMLSEAQSIIRRPPNDLETQQDRASENPGHD